MGGNLIPNSERTPSELREITRKGGVRSGESRRRKKTMREWLELALNTKMKDSNGEVILSPDTGKALTREEAGMIKLAASFANGNLKAIKLAAELLGEKVEKTEVTGKDGSPLIPTENMTEEEIMAEIEKIRQSREK